MKKKSEFRIISPQILSQQLKGEVNFHLIDTLTQDHFEKVRLPHATNICVFDVTFLDQIKEVVKGSSKNFILYGSSKHSMDATTAAEKLMRAGYQNINILDGGLEAWHEFGLPLEGSDISFGAVPKEIHHLNDGAYSVDTKNSHIEWAGRNPNSKHFGTVQLTSGTISVKSGTIEGSFDIDMQSIENISLKGNEYQPVLVSHLKSDDFFFVKHFPKATFKIKSGSLLNTPCTTSPNHLIKGSLILMGITADIEFNSTIIKNDENGFIAEAHFDLDRTQWGVIYGSARFFERLGMHVVFDLVSIEVRIIANSSPE